MDRDLALVEAFRAGDPSAFTELVRRHREAVFRVAVSVLGRGFEAEAEEVAQEVFVRAHDALATFRGEARLGTWLHRIAFNRAVNLKSRMRFRAPHLGDEALATLASSEAGPHGELEATRRAHALEEAIRELPEVYQSALRLHYWMEVGLADIAELLEVPHNTVKSYLFRARRLLGAKMREKGFDDV